MVYMDIVAFCSLFAKASLVEPTHRLTVAAFAPYAVLDNLFDGLWAKALVALELPYKSPLLDTVS